MTKQCRLSVTISLKFQSFLYFSDDPKHRQVLKEFNRQESQDVASSSRSPGMNMAVFLVFIDCLVNNITVNNLVIAPAMNKCHVH